MGGRIPSALFGDAFDPVCFVVAFGCFCNGGPALVENSDSVLVMGMRRNLRADAIYMDRSVTISFSYLMTGPIDSGGAGYN